MQLRIVDADEWKQVFLGDEKLYEGHSVSLHDWEAILKRLGIPVTREYVEICCYCEAQFPEGSGALDRGVCAACRAGD